MPHAPTMVKLTRRVAFSAGHRYWFEHLGREENRDLFGPWASPYNHGHNYALEVTVAGPVDPRTGMVVNIKDIDDLLQERIVRTVDGKSLNDEVEWFRTHAPTVENILLWVRELVVEEWPLPREAALVSLKLEETPLFWGELAKAGENWTMTLTRTYEFAASHRLHVSALSAEENVALFGKCNNPAGHGHNYVLEVTVEGEPDARTGMMAPLEEIDRRVEELVVDRYDHKNLNEDLPEFRDVVPTSEVFVAEIFRRLDGQLPAKLRRVRLLETARNIFEVEAAR